MTYVQNHDRKQNVRLQKDELYLTNAEQVHKIYERPSVTIPAQGVRVFVYNCRHCSVLFINYFYNINFRFSSPLNRSVDRWSVPGSFHNINHLFCAGMKGVSR